MKVDSKRFMDAYLDASPEAQDRVQAVLREYALGHRDLTEEESEEAGEKIAAIINQDRVGREGKKRSLTSMLRHLREQGWRVAVHNDYQQNGKLFTFWLFTHSSGRWLKGEAATDEDAVSNVFSQVFV